MKWWRRSINLSLFFLVQLEDDAKVFIIIIGSNITIFCVGRKYTCVGGILDEIRQRQLARFYILYDLVVVLCSEALRRDRALLCDYLLNVILEQRRANDSFLSSQIFTDNIFIMCSPYTTANWKKRKRCPHLMVSFIAISDISTIWLLWGWECLQIFFI